MQQYYFFSGCNTVSPNQKVIDTAFQETLWELVSFQDEKGKKSESGTSEINLIFHKDSTLSGASSSNEYESSYSYSIQNYSLDIQILGSTEVGEPNGSKYMIYLTELQKVHSYKIHEDELTLYYGEKKTSTNIQSSCGI